MVPRRDADALADAIVRLARDPGERARLGANARRTGAQYDIDLFVRKMERLYVLLHETSRATHRKSVLSADLSFLTSGAASSMTRMAVYARWRARGPACGIRRPHDGGGPRLSRVRRVGRFSANREGVQGRRGDLLQPHLQHRARRRLHVPASGSDPGLGGVLRARRHLPQARRNVDFGVRPRFPSSRWSGRRTPRGAASTTASRTSIRSSRRRSSGCSARTGSWCFTRCC